MQESIKQTKKFYSKLGFIFMFGTIGIYAVQLIPMYLAAAIKPEWMANGNISLLISWVLGALITYFCYRRGKWKHKAITSETE